MNAGRTSLIALLVAAGLAGATLFAAGAAAAGGADGRVYFAGGGDQIQRITPPSEPGNTFVFARGKSTKRGVAEIGVEVPGPGKLELKPLGFWRYGKPERKLNGTA